MKILRNYILSELVASFLLSLGIFTFVLLMGNMIKLAELVITKGVALIYCAKLFGYMTPYLLSYSIPMSILTATLLTFGRLTADNEITAIRASGISLFKIGVPLVIFGLMLSMGSIILNDRILPNAHYNSRKVLADITMDKPAAYLEAGTFIKSFKNYIVFIYEIDGNKLSHIRIYNTRENKPTKTIVARRGEFIPLPEKNAIKLKLFKGFSDEPDPDYPGRFFRLNFNTYEVTLHLKSLGERIDKKPKDMSIDELRTEISKFKEQSVDTYPLLTEIHKKISLSFSALFFILIGLPVALLTKRGERSVGFGLSLGLIIIYYILMVAGEAMSLKGFIHPAICMWLPNGFFGVCGVVLSFFNLER